MVHWTSTDYTFEPTAGSSQFTAGRSTGRLITDIWRTGSGQSKRFGAPLAIADSDVISSPGRDGEREGFWRRGFRGRSGHRAWHATAVIADDPAAPLAE